MLAPLLTFGACCSAVHSHITVAHAGEERSVLYKALLGIRRQRPASGRGSIQLLTCARVTALCLSLITGLLLVLATRHPPVQQVLKGGVQKAGELLQGVRTPAFEVSAGLLCQRLVVLLIILLIHMFSCHVIRVTIWVCPFLSGRYCPTDDTNMHTVLIAQSALPV
jgi:hypothetical protein